MKLYRKTKIDANQKAIVDHIEGHGGRVIVLGDPVDLLGHWKGFTGLIEAKVSGRSTYTRKQLRWIAESGPIPVAIVKNGDEAMRFLQTRRGLSQEQKNWIAIFLVGNPGDKWNGEKIEKVING